MLSLKIKVNAQNPGTEMFDTRVKNALTQPKNGMIKTFSNTGFVLDWLPRKSFLDSSSSQIYIIQLTINFWTRSYSNNPFNIII